MTKREAKKYVYRMAAESLRADIATGADWIEEAPDDAWSQRFSLADIERVEIAAMELAAELDRRGNR